MGAISSCCRRHSFTNTQAQVKVQATSIAKFRGPSLSAEEYPELDLSQLAGGKMRTCGCCNG